MKTQIKPRASLYYGKYVYAVNFGLTEAGCIRHWQTDKGVATSIEARKEIEAYRNAQWTGFSKYPSKGTKPIPTAFNSAVVHDLYEFAKLLRAQTQDFKLVVSYGIVYLYTNDVAFVQELYNRYNDRNFLVTETSASVPNNVIVLKNPPRYHYRTYFKSREVTPETKDVLRNWVKGMGREVRPSPALKEWLTVESKYFRWNINYLERHYYVEHNDAKLDVWMAIVAPGTIRKTMQVVQEGINS